MAYAIAFLVLAIVGLSLGLSPLFAVLLLIPLVMGYLLWVGTTKQVRPENITRGGRPIEEVPEREADVYKSAEELHEK